VSVLFKKVALTKYVLAVFVFVIHLGIDKMSVWFIALKFKTKVDQVYGAVAVCCRSTKSLFGEAMRYFCNHKMMLPCPPPP